MHSLILEWKNFLTNEKGFSKHTASSYIIDLNYFLKFISEYHSYSCTIKTLESLSLQDFRAWLAYRKKNEFAFTSTNRAIASVKNFFKYLIRFHKFNNKSIFNLKTPKTPSSLPKALSEKQTFSALNSSEEQNLWITQRDKAILYLLYGCGLRISEALSLKKRDIAKNTIIITGKGNKQRMVPIINSINEIIATYLNQCPYEIKNDDLIFIGKQGKPLNPGVFQRHIRNVRRNLNLPESTTPHAFRHSFATHILANGGDLKSIQDLLGHQNLSTTQKYTKIDSTHLLNVYNKAHPHSNK